MNSSDDPGKKPLNSLRLLGDVLAATVGIRSRRERGRDVSPVGTGALPGAISILAVTGFVALKSFIHPAKNAAAQ
ncbi:hypothetical protein DFR24_4712 [Panacagrimonas perspica]|uniref:Uncharacterized protein n=1 Tax=Panacagrimonas perspica TaxID=381431 RepID=A0A4S3K0K9_9GAMM|nr:hypothetical protein [Panacagrimonas perspica]TDU24442.1 hypothetical protein DFR24_4712 [Panacagrimonas perspica]THD01426.1 hypothetical protein B1810_19995 [Panacagrimonas perspica]